MRAGLAGRCCVYLAGLALGRGDGLSRAELDGPGGPPCQLLLEGVLDFLAGLLEVALGLIGLALGLEGLITGGLCRCPP